MTLDGATFADNRGWGINYPYRDPEFERANGDSFYSLARRSMISDSYGWLPNRAARIYYEAWAEQERREREAHDAAVQRMISWTAQYAILRARGELS